MIAIRRRVARRVGFSRALSSPLHEPVMKLVGVKRRRVPSMSKKQFLDILISLENICGKRYGKEIWYNKKLKGGWPGVEGDVLLGRPVIDRFGEFIVVEFFNRRPRSVFLHRP